ncbi:MAG: translational GTPase TypA [Candidatus Paceibacterota bacterium]
MEIRNIAIIAHVDHGKTTLTDALMKQTGVVKDDASMDSNTLEQERGITIYSKNTSIKYKDTKINIVDTPGHADFGSEVERVLRSIDTVLLVVDAQEGPMPQTRFVLKKSLELGLNPIVAINKIDKPAANPDRVEEEILELFYDLGANEKQAEFPVVYAIGLEGIAKKNLDDESSDLTPLLDAIINHVPSASTEELISKPLRFQSFNLAYDNFLGRMAIGRIYEGVLKLGEKVYIKKPNGKTREGKTTKIFSFDGVERVEIEEASAGDIVMVAGLDNIDIGETVTIDQDSEPLVAIKVDEPTISLSFMPNSSPFRGKEGKYVTSRQIRDYLERELEVNVGLKVDFDSGDYFKVYGRGELHISILLENMRRADYEVEVSQPHVIIREENGVKTEPYEEVIIDIPEEFQGAIIKRLGTRGFVMQNMIQVDSVLRLTFEGPTRGLLGYRNQFVVDTKGEGLMSSRVIGFRKYAGDIQKRHVGSMISMTNGKTLGFSLWNLQERGQLYIGPAVEVYEGMVIGNTAKGEDMMVNPTKGKQLTNMRSSGSDDAIELTPPLTLTIERGLEIMDDDEYLEVTPKSVRLRKEYLTESERKKANKK